MKKDKQIVLTISILISNNYDNVKRCLDSVKPLLSVVPSELILTDTGVTEKLRKLLEEYTDNIIDFKWCDDFSAARNEGLHKARGQWFLYIDDDEWFEDTTAISDFLMSGEEKNYNVACYVQRNYTEKSGREYRDAVVDRILRINPKLHFEHRVHEAYTDIDIKEKKQLYAIAHHFGYCYEDEAQMMKKHIRNQKLLEAECLEHPEDMRMQYQMVINPYTVKDWDTSISLAQKAIKRTSNSEYWDACHSSIIYCLEKKGEWNKLIETGKEFLNKPLYPYDKFGIMQYMVDAYWNMKQYNELCDISEQALELYEEYCRNPMFFNRNQLMRTTFVEKEYMLYFLMYSIAAGLIENREKLMKKLTTGATAGAVKDILNTPEYANWISSNVTVKEKVQQEVTTMENERLVFKPDFFEREERNGFVIEPMMKNAWAANIYVLNIVDRICRENNIKYFADWGTLLGAVRHKGYIPWDDDIDICMIRDDYRRFCDVIDQYKDEVVLLNAYTDDTRGECADKVVNVAAFTVKRSEIKEYYGFPFTAGVDIFLVDYVPRDKALEEEQIEVLRTISLVINIRAEKENHTPLSKEYADCVKAEMISIEKIKQMTHVEFEQPNPTNQELLILRDEVSGLYGNSDADYLAQMQLLGCGWDYYIPREVYAQAIRMPFENTTIPVPQGYDMLLRKKYGDDYMTPINKGAGHGYPFYDKAIEEVAKSKKQSEDEVEKYVQEIAIDYYHEFLHKSANPKLSLKKEYFEAESIDGIEITEEQKRARAAQLEVYLEVKRICDKHNITIFAVGDTLKGVAEKNDFLPESNEINLAIARPDYMNFLVILQKELGPWFDYRNVYSYEEYEDMRCYVFSDSYLCDENEFSERFHGCKENVGIYISAIDNLSEETSKEDVRKMLVQNLLTTAQSMPKQPPYTDAVIDIVEEWKRMTQVDIDIKNNLCREFVKAADCTAGGYRGECEQVRISSELQKDVDKCYNKEWFDDTIEMKFSKITIPVPVGYKEILKK